jgi:hypothetical protein
LAGIGLSPYNNPFATNRVGRKSVSDPLINGTKKDVDELTDLAKQYYSSPAKDRSRHQSRMMFDAVNCQDRSPINPAFERTDSLKKLLNDISLILARMNSRLFTKRDLKTLRDFVKNRAVNSQKACPDQRSSDLIIPYGHSDLNEIMISFSNERWLNIASSSHELGHLIHKISVPDPAMKSIWRKDRFVKEDDARLVEWYVKNLVPDKDSMVSATHIEELISDLVAMSVLAVFNGPLRSTLRIMLEKASDDDHRPSREKLLSFMDRRSTSLYWPAKARKAIHWYYSLPSMPSLNTLFSKLFQT